MEQTQRETTTRQPWYGDGLCFACQRSGNCCTGPRGFVWFNPAEAKAMAKQLGLEVEVFLKRYARLENGHWTLEEHRTDAGDYDCVFLERDEEGKALCRVYKVRPTQCRTWPFWAENLKSKRTWSRAAKNCPGMTGSGGTGGKLYSLAQIRIIEAENPDGL